MLLLDPANSFKPGNLREAPVGPFKTASQRNAEFARQTAKIPFSTNIFQFLEHQIVADSDDDDESVAKKVIPKTNTRKSKGKGKITKESEFKSKRRRNMDKMHDDQLISKHNISTIKIGSIANALNPLFVATGFRDLLDEILIY